MMQNECGQDVTRGDWPRRGSGVAPTGPSRRPNHSHGAAAHFRRSGTFPACHMKSTSSFQKFTSPNNGMAQKDVSGFWQDRAIPRRWPARHGLH